GRGPGNARLCPRHRRTGRYAGAYPDRAHRRAAFHPGLAGKTDARHVAGNLSVRAPRPAAPARSRHASYWRLEPEIVEFRVALHIRRDEGTARHDLEASRPRRFEHA